MAATREGAGRRTAAIAAGLGAFAASAAGADSTLDLKILGYREDAGRTQVIDPVLYYDQDFGEKGRLGILAAFDTISGASPTGEAPRLDATSGASAATGSIPKVTYDDTRTALSLSYGRRFGSHLPTATLSYSRESDYLSQGVSLVDAWEFAGGRSTLRLGAGTSWDVVEPVTTNLSHDKRSLSLSTGWTQVLGPRDLLDVSLGREHLSGYLTDPYKVVSVGAAVVPEVRPDARDRWSALLKYGHYFPWKGALKSSYRYYWDDWDVRAHTLDLVYDQRIGRRLIVSPRLRYYTQAAASFFAYEFTAPRPAMSGDYRLSGFWNWLYGIGLTVNVSDRLSFTAAGTYQEQVGRDRVRPRAATPAPPPSWLLGPEDDDEDDGSGGTGPVSPADLRVYTATLGFTLKF